MSSFVHATTMWWAMTLAMMLPTAIPTFRLVDRLRRDSGARAPVSMGAFAAGYGAIWLGYGLVAALLQLALVRKALLASNLELVGPAAGVVLVGAGLYQLTPLKNACLSRCRNPFSYFLTHWSDGLRGSLRMGVGHGLDCLGCCWALMATAFALGVMNLLWMAVLTVVVWVEKLAPRGELLARAFGVASIAFGLWVGMTSR